MIADRIQYMASVANDATGLVTQLLHDTIVAAAGLAETWRKDGDTDRYARDMNELHQRLSMQVRDALGMWAAFGTIIDPVTCTSRTVGVNPPAVMLIESYLYRLGMSPDPEAKTLLKQLRDTPGSNFKLN